MDHLLIIHHNPTLPYFPLDLFGRIAQIAAYILITPIIGYSFSLSSQKIEEPMIQVDEQANLLERSTEFFASPKFRGLQDELKTLQVETKEISEVSLKCYGYGYFPKYKEIIKENLLRFIKECLDALPNLISFKLILNGFDIANKYLQQITTLIKKALNRGGSPLLAIWVHTNHLTGCKHADFIDMLDLIVVAGAHIHREDISIQITNWRFDINISLPDLEEDFKTLIANSFSGLNFKKFRLELSSWYLHLEEAFTFIKTGMRHPQILQKMGIKEDEAGPRKLIMDYLENTQHQSYAEFTSARNELQRRLKSDIGRNLHEQIVFYLIKNFQEKIVELVHAILECLPHVEDFTIDFRNWNPLLKMHELRSVLQTKSGSKQEFSMIQRKSQQLAQTQGDGKDEPVLRTTYLI